MYQPMVKTIMYFQLICNADGLDVPVNVLQVFVYHLQSIYMYPVYLV